MIKTTKKTTGGKDSSISDTFKTVGNNIDSIGSTAEKIGDYVGVGPVINTITNVASKIANGISSAFQFLGLGDHVSRIETHLGLEPMTREEREYYSAHQRLHNDYADELHELGKRIYQKYNGGRFDIAGSERGGRFDIAGSEKGGRFDIAGNNQIRDNRNDWV